MKVDKVKLGNVASCGKYGRIIACSIYLYHKDPHGKGEHGNTMHEKVAALVIKGYNRDEIAAETGYELQIVEAAIIDIQAFAGAEETL